MSHLKMAVTSEKCSENVDKLCEIPGSLGGEYEDVSLLGYSAL